MMTVQACLFVIIVSMVAGCSFKDTKSSLVLDLTALAHTVLSLQDVGTNWTYSFTPCRQGNECTNIGPTDTGMSIRTNDKNNNCEILSNWDDSIRPVFTEIDDTWTFEYQNGNICNNKTIPIFYAYFACNMKVGDYKIIQARELDPCQYAMFIESQWACPGMIYEQDKISFGTYFIIVIFTGILLYVIIGWFICACQNKRYDDCVGNIPHVTFWSKLPLLVFAGCGYSKDMLCGLCSSKK
eukprot:533408_1